MRWITQRREVILPALIIAVAILVLGNLVVHDFLTASIFTENAVALDALSDATTISAVVVGAVFSYYRFFRGRTFFRRAEPRLSVAVYSTSEDYNLHAVTLELKNIGSMAIWNPVPVVEVFEYGPEGVSKTVWENWQEARSPWATGEDLSIVDSGETVSFISHKEVPKVKWAVAYVAFIHCDGGDIWKCATTASNTTMSRN
jgi:hypothetical protein